MLWEDTEVDTDTLNLRYSGTFVNQFPYLPNEGSDSVHPTGLMS